MYKYNIYIGMFDKDTKQQELSNTEFLNKVRSVMRSMHIDNYTIYKGKGHYRSELQVVTEPSINIEMIRKGLFLYQQLNSFKVRLCKELNQEDVLITRTEVEIL